MMRHSMLYTNVHSFYFYKQEHCYYLHRYECQECTLQQIHQQSQVGCAHAVAAYITSYKELRLKLKVTNTTE